MRERKIGLVHTIGHVMQMASSRSADGYRITSQNYFAPFQRGRVARSSLSEAREKIDWRAFEFLLRELNKISQVIKWRAHRPFAADGTRLNLPHTPEIIESFPLDPDGRRYSADI